MAKGDPKPLIWWEDSFACCLSCTKLAHSGDKPMGVSNCMAWAWSCYFYQLASRWSSLVGWFPLWLFLVLFLLLTFFPKVALGHQTQGAYDHDDHDDDDGKQGGWFRGKHSDHSSFIVVVVSVFTVKILCILFLPCLSSSYWLFAFVCFAKCVCVHETVVVLFTVGIGGRRVMSSSIHTPFNKPPERIIT